MRKSRSPVGSSGWQSTRSTTASGGDSRGSRARKLSTRVGAAVHLEHDAALVVEHESAELLLAREAVHVRPEADALDDALDARAHAGLAHGQRAPLPRLDELAQQVRGGGMRLLDARDVLRAAHDEVVGEPLRGHGAAVVADERDRRETALARLDQRVDDAARVAARRERDQRVADASVGDDLRA